MDWTKININNIYQNDKQSIQWMQRQLGVKDDGIIGEKTIKALQRMVGTKDDGKWGNNSRLAATQYFSKFGAMHQVPQVTPDPKSMLQRSSTSVRPFFVPFNEPEVVIATGMEDVPQVESPQQTEQPKQSRFVENLSKAMTAFGMHNSQNAIPIREKPYDKYNGMSSREYIESIPQTENLDVSITQNIPTISRASNMAMTIPEHAINQFTGRVVMPLFGENGDEIAQAIENAKTPEEKQTAREKLWKVPGFTGASQAEKADIMAALAYLNGNKPMTYDDYLKAIEKAGKEPGSWLGSDYNRSTGNSYTHMNRAEDAMGTKDRQIEVPEDATGLNRFVRNTYNAGVRIWDTPNRGRYGGWRWRVTDTGDIQIADAFEATEQQAARGKNDSDSYNAARDSWQRGTTHRLSTTISTDEQAKYLRRALNTN